MTPLDELDPPEDDELDAPLDDEDELLLELDEDDELEPPDGAGFDLSRPQPVSSKTSTSGRNRPMLRFKAG